jgi:hypothetical protein
MKPLEVPPTESGLIITIGSVPTGQFTIPIVETGMKEKVLPKHIGIIPFSLDTIEGIICA